MLKLSELKQEWGQLSWYDRFEQIATRIIILFVSVAVIDSVALAGIELFKDFRLGFTERKLLQDIFGPTLTILILLEFNHSIALALTKKLGVIQARAIVLITIIVVARKIILLDFSAVSTETLLGLGGIALALGALYWLLAVERQNI